MKSLNSEKKISQVEKVEKVEEVKEEVIDFGLIRSPLMVRNDPKFSEFFKSVWSVLNDE